MAEFWNPAGRGAAVRDELREARRRAAEDLFAPLAGDDRKAPGELLALLGPGQPG